MFKLFEESSACLKKLSTLQNLDKQQKASVCVEVQRLEVAEKKYRQKSRSMNLRIAQNLFSASVPVNKETITKPLSTEHASKYQRDKSTQSIGISEKQRVDFLQKGKRDNYWFFYGIPAIAIIFGCVLYSLRKSY